MEGRRPSLHNTLYYRINRPRGRGCQGLAACFFLLYALTSPGDLVGDSEVRWAVAKRIAATGWVDLPPGTTAMSVEGVGGKRYSWYGPGQSVCLVPFVWAGRGLSALALPISASADTFGQLLASLIFFPLCGALAVALLYAIVLDATGDRSTARWTAVIYGVATMHWHHTINTYEESQVALCVLASLWAFQRAWRCPAWRYPFMAVGAIGAALCFRMTTVTISAPLGVTALAYDLTRRSGAGARLRRLGGWLLAGLLGLGPFGIALGAYNAARFGSAMDTGYGRGWAEAAGMGLFDTPLLTGLAGMVLSPGKSVLLFNPVLLAGACGAAGLWREHRGLAMVAVSTVLGTLLFHSTVTFWAGDLAWGPRYLACVMGLCVLPLVPVMQRSRGRRIVIPLALLSVCIQLASVTYSFGLEFFQDRRHGLVPDGYVWRPAESQLVCRFRNIGRHLLGRPDYHCTPPRVERPQTHQTTVSTKQVRHMHALNMFPFKAWANTGNVRVFVGLLTLWITGWAGLILVIRRWRHYARSAERRNER